MTAFKDALDQLWPGDVPPDLPSPAEGLGAPAGFRPPRTPAETRADETTRVAREMIDAVVEERQAKTARLRRARLEKEAQKAAEPTPPKTRRKRG